jgi:prophage DNA circulation protein
MGLIDQIKDILANGPNDWKARVRDSIELTSPAGATFTAKWQAGPRDFDKKLGIFAYPKVKGNIIQDLDVNSTRYNLKIFFEGAQHDKTASSFFTACRETGTWEVIHPIHGFLELQLVSVREMNDPIRSGNLTAIDTRWLEPIDPISLLTAAELAAIIDEKIKDLNVNAAQQFADNLNQKAEAFSRAIESATTKAALITDLVTKPLFDSIDALDTAMTAIQQGINDVKTQTTILTDSLAGQLQQLTQLPSLGIGDGQAKGAVYSDLVDDLVRVLPTTVRQPESAKNEAAVSEICMVAALGAVAKVATISTLVTRTQALELASLIVGIFESVTTNLDAVQAAFSGTDFYTQYFSQSQTYLQAADLIATANKYLLTLAPSLQVEKRIILDRPRSPIEITITEYGTLGDNDEKFDLFIETNKLKGDDILLLDRGTEVVVYA